VSIQEDGSTTMKPARSRRYLGMALAAPLALALAGPVAADTVSFEAVFRESFGRGNAASGVGHVGGALVTEVFTFGGEVRTGDPRCPARTIGTTVFTWPDGSTVTVDERWLICFPGFSREAPGSAVSYGNPEHSTGTFEIVDGSGVFRDIAGGGTITAKFAGDIIVIHYSGSATLP